MRNLNEIIHNYKINKADATAPAAAAAAVRERAGNDLCVHKESCCAATTINIYIFWHWLAWIPFLTVWFFLLHGFLLLPWPPPSSSLLLLLIAYFACVKQKKRDCFSTRALSFHKLFYFIAKSRARKKQSERTVNWKNFGSTYIAFWLEIHQTITH